MALLELSNISYAVKDKTIIRDVSLAVNEGDYLTIVGPSGSGKSTLLKLCSDLISPTFGSITYNGRNLTAIDPESYRKEVGYCFQRPYLFAKSVRRNILFPYDIRGMKPDMERIKFSLTCFICLWSILSVTMMNYLAVKCNGFASFVVLYLNLKYCS